MESWLEGIKIPRKIAVEGNIGAGKTTLSKRLAEYIGYKLIEEPVADNELLPLFYKDPHKYGFAFQVHMLTIRCALEHAGTNLIEGNLEKGVVYDRTLSGDTCFALTLNKMGQISDVEVKVYLKLYELMKYYSLFPDVVIFLDIPIEELKDRIKKRGRECENGIEDSYLREVDKNYRIYIEAMRRSTSVVKLNGQQSLQEPKVIWDRIVEGFNLRDHSRYERKIGDCVTILGVDKTIKAVLKALSEKQSDKIGEVVQVSRCIESFKYGEEAPKQCSQKF